MPLSLLFVLGLVGIGLILNARWQAGRLPDPDQAAREELAAAGVDLEAALDMEFGFYFPAPDGAERIRRSLASLGYATTVTPEGEENRWTCLAFVRMVPELTQLRSLRREFTRLAATERGLYAGWRVAPSAEEPSAA